MKKMRGGALHFNIKRAGYEKSRPVFYMFIIYQA